MARNKIKHQTINFIVDDNGVGLERWGIRHKSSAVIVLDASGKVLFVKDGTLSEVEIDRTIELIENQMFKAANRPISIQPTLSSVAFHKPVSSKANMAPFSIE